MARGPEPFAEFLLLRRLSVGALAETFLAEATRGPLAGRPLVLKRALPTTAEDPEARARFLWQMEVGRRLRHPGFPRVLGGGERRSLPFLLLEHVDGRELSALREQAAVEGAALPLGVVSYIASELLRALAELHEMVDDRGLAPGLVHQDVTPRNILISLCGDVRLTDLGATIATASPEGVAEAQRVLSPGYAAPEQVTGGPLDPRTDLFAVGLVVAELLAARRALQPGEPWDLAAVAASRARLLGAIRDERARDLVATLSALRADERPESARAAAARWAELEGDRGEARRALAALAAATPGGSDAP